MRTFTYLAEEFKLLPYHNKVSPMKFKHGFTFTF